MSGQIVETRGHKDMKRHQVKKHSEWPREETDRPSRIMQCTVGENESRAQVREKQIWKKTEMDIETMTLK